MPVQTRSMTSKTFTSKTSNPSKTYDIYDPSKTHIHILFIENALRDIYTASSTAHKIIESDKLYTYLATDALDFVKNNKHFMNAAITKAYEIKKKDKNHFTSFDSFLIAVGQPTYLEDPYWKDDIHFISFTRIPYKYYDTTTQVVQITSGDDIWDIDWDGKMVIICSHILKIAYECEDATIRDILVSFFESRDIVPDNDESIDVLVSTCPLVQCTVYDDHDHSVFGNQ